MLAVVAVVISPLTTYTPHIDGENAISDLREIDVNGSKQWISIRGQDKSKPIILFLSGGPGGSQMANARIALGDLEKDFVMVQWDQPGSGKSRHAVPLDEITPQRYVDDGHVVTQYLKKEFNQQKIYIIGESWGSALGIMLAQKYPEDYAAFMGTGQMIDFKQTEIDDYNLALKTAKERNDTDVVDKLKKRGTPPYYGGDMSVALDSITYLNYLNGEMGRRGQIYASKSDIFKTFLEPEYDVAEKYDWAAGVIFTFGHVYQQLYDINFRESATKLDIPTYFLIGRHDLNAPTYFTEEYYNLLDAPKKGLVWFEHSGHAPWNSETDVFIENVRKIATDNPVIQ